MALAISHFPSLSLAIHVTAPPLYPITLEGEGEQEGRDGGGGKERKDEREENAEGTKEGGGGVAVRGDQRGGRRGVHEYYRKVMLPDAW